MMSRNEAEHSAEVVHGTFSINFVLVKTLCDSEEAFVSSSLIKSQNLVDFEVIDLPVSIPTGVTLRW